MKTDYIPYRLQFKFDAGTSRGIIREKTTFFIKIHEEDNPEKVGWGEAAPLAKLSIDDRADFEERLRFYLRGVGGLTHPWEFYRLPGIEEFPSIVMALETALRDLENGGKKMIYSAAFAEQEKRLPINGLVWMGSKEFMKEQIQAKIEAGFDCIKMKIGAIDFEQECSLLQYIRQQFTASEIELRVDANGAFTPTQALERLKRLSEYELHSIEQPIRQGQWGEMARLCEQTPLPIALDEELIGLPARSNKQELLEAIKPQYIILKPTLVGGFKESDEWIALAESLNIGWWMTSALEANIGLNAIAQFTEYKKATLPQGLGTGQLFHNNIHSPLSIEQGHIYSDLSKEWGAPTSSN